jgi:hypothetical protein
MDEALPTIADTACAGCSSAGCSLHDDALSRDEELRELAL